MEYGNRVIKSTIQIFILSIIGMFLGFLLRVFLSRTLSIADYGLFYTVLAFVGVFVPLKDLGLNETLVKFIPDFLFQRKQRNIKSLFIFILLVQLLAGSIIASLIILFSDYIAIAYIGSASASLPLKLIAASFVFSIFITLFRVIFQGFGKMFSYALMEPLRVLISFVFIIGFIWLGVTGAAIGYFAASIVLPLVIFPIIRKRFQFLKEKFVVDFKLFKKTIVFGFSLVLGGVGGTVLAYFDTLIIKGFGTLKDVALYQVALPTAQLLNIFPAVFSVILLPLTSELWVTKQKDKLEDCISLFLKFGLIIVVFFSIWLVSFSNTIIEFLFGGVYKEASLALIVLSFGVIFYTMASIIWFTLMGIGRPFVMTKLLLSVAVLNLVLNFLLIPNIGFIGAAISNVIAYFIGFLISFYYISKKTSFKVDVYPLLKVIFCGLLAFLTVFIIKNYFFGVLEAILSLFFGSVVYLVSIFFLKCVVKRDLNVLKQTNIKIPRCIIKWLKLIKLPES